MNILQVLVQKKIIKESDLPLISAEVRNGETTLEKVLLKYGVSQTDIISAKGESSGIPARQILDQEIPFEILKFIPEDSAMHYRFIPIGVSDGVLEVGVVDPDNIEARDALNFISSKIGMPFKIFLISEEDFEKVIQDYKGLSGEVTKALSELDTDIEVTGEGGESESETPQKKVNVKITEDAPVTKIVATILRYATEGGASDVHIEPMSDRVRVRFRVDGVLGTSLVLPNKIHKAVLARIKILSNMKLDENRKPQDGRFSARVEGRKVDIRVSTFPSFYGEKVVMRILDQAKGVKGLDEIGLSPRNLQLIRDSIKRPFGMILISGPTGSGKTTTLYSMLNEINREEKNVLSLEDPVEYNIEGMSQSQVRPEIGYTFATGLRTTLRQDPDVIMVGEIRDKETAQLAVQAALTGHLVLSTIHTNNSVGVIPRLINMGVDPYLIGPTLILAMAQRLVNKVCVDSIKPIPLEGGRQAMIEKQFADLPAEYKKELPPFKEVCDAVPTPECPTGTKGRVAVFEMFPMDTDIENTILKNQATEAEIMKITRKKGMITMKEDAIIKALRKEIPFGEINKL